MTPSELQASLDRKAAEMAVTCEITKHLEQVQASLLDHTVSAEDFRKLTENNDRKQKGKQP